MELSGLEEVQGHQCSPQPSPIITPSPHPRGHIQRPPGHFQRHLPGQLMPHHYFSEKKFSNMESEPHCALLSHETRQEIPTPATSSFQGGAGTQAPHEPPLLQAGHPQLGQPLLRKCFPDPSPAPFPLWPSPAPQCQGQNWTQHSGVPSTGDTLPLRCCPHYSWHRPDVLVLLGHLHTPGSSPYRSSCSFPQPIHPACQDVSVERSKSDLILGKLWENNNVPWVCCHEIHPPDDFPAIS